MFKFGSKPNKKVKSLVKLLPKNGKVLDLGCGMGMNSVFLAEYGFDVVCADKDKENIDYIKKNYPQISAINKNILGFNFPKEEYDLVLAFNVLNFFKLENVKRIINNIIKSLKKDGLLCLQTFSVNDSSYNKFLEIAEKKGGKNTFYSKKTQNFTHFFTKEELLGYFSDNTILECEELMVKDNHPPQGRHEHSIIRVLVRKT